MEKDVLITICGTQQMLGEAPETIELVTRGTYRFAPGFAELSYVETQMTGLEGVLTTFTVEDDTYITLTRTGKVNSVMRFAVGKRDDSLYDAEGVGPLLVTVCARSMTVLLNENGGVFDLEYDVEIEHTACGTNGYHIEVRVQKQP